MLVYTLIDRLIVILLVNLFYFFMLLVHHLIHIFYVQEVLDGALKRSEQFKEFHQFLDSSEEKLEYTKNALDKIEEYLKQ